MLNEFLDTLDKSSKIIDVGCGSGRLCLHLMQTGFSQVTGIDVSEEVIKRASRRGRKAKACFKAIDLFDMSYESKFDVVFCQLLLHHILPNDEPLFIEKLHSIMVPDTGLLFLTFLKTDNPVVTCTERESYFSKQHNVIMYNPEYVKESLRSSGLKEIIKEGDYTMPGKSKQFDYHIIICK